MPLGGFSELGDLRRAAISVSNNIAEGFERCTNQELLTFLYIARGSAGDVRSMLCLLSRIGAFCDLESEIRNLKGRGESISKQLGAWIQSIQNSGLKGQRDVTEKARRARTAAEDRRRFLTQLEQIRAGQRNPATRNEKDAC